MTGAAVPQDSRFDVENRHENGRAVGPLDQLGRRVECFEQLCWSGTGEQQRARRAAELTHHRGSRQDSATVTVAVARMSPAEKPAKTSKSPASTRQQPASGEEAKARISDAGHALLIWISGAAVLVQICRSRPPDLDLRVTPS